MDGGKSCPQGEVNVVRPLNVHRHALGRSVGHKWMQRMARWREYVCADWLFSEIIIKDSLLDVFHDLLSEEANYSQIHPRIHQSERITSGDDTIKRG